MKKTFLFERQSQILTSRKIDRENAQLQGMNTVNSKSTNKIIYSKNFNESDELRQTMSNLKFLFKIKRNNNLSAQRILQQWPDVEGNKQVLTGLQILKKKQLLQDKQINLNNIKGKHRVEFIYNDYHLKSTNPGYSRNNLGCLYTR